MENKHHIYGPSTLDALSKCVRFKYDDNDTDAATEGTELHKAAELENTNGLNDEQRICVQTVLNYVESLKFEDGATPEDWKDIKEASVSLKGLTHGTADRILINEKLKRIHVVDYKFTRVENDHDLQLLAYGAAVVEGLTDPAEYLVSLHVVAPRLSDATRTSHSAILLLETAREEIEKIYERIENPFTPPQPHEDLCAKCARAGQCPAIRETALTVAPQAGLQLPSTFDIDRASPKDRAILHILASSLEQVAKKWKASNTKAAEEGLEIPGFKLRSRSTGLRAPKEQVLEFADRLRTRYKMTTADLLACANITMGDVYKHLAMLTGRPEADIKEEIRTNDTDILQEGTATYLAKEKRVSDAELLAIVAGE